MEIIIVVALIVFWIIIQKILSGNTKAVEKLRNEISYLRQEITQLSDRIEFKQTTPIKPPQAAVKEVEEQKIIITPVEKIITPSQIVQEEKIQKPEPAKPIEKIPQSVSIVVEDNPEEKLPPQIKRSWFEQWLYDNPDIEKFIGENLINKIGIAVLVLGIAFFVKYAIDQEWINKVGRVCIGLFCGAILIGLAHRLRKNYHSFSSVLVGGGLTVFYFTIAFAYHQYHLIDQTPSFVIMIVITVFAVILSVLYDRIELGIIATIGGFITPFLVSNGDGNYIALFTYVAILNAGLIVLAYINDGGC